MTICSAARPEMICAGCVTDRVEPQVTRTAREMLFVDD